jgi:hypothetical protein
MYKNLNEDDHNNEGQLCFASEREEEEDNNNKQTSTTRCTKEYK